MYDFNITEEAQNSFLTNTAHIQLAVKINPLGIKKILLYF